MSAHPVLDDLSAFLDGELPAARAAEVEAHVRTCATCARWLQEVRAAETLVGGEPGEAPAGYHEDFVERLRPRLVARRRPKAWAWSAAAAAALLAVLVAPALLRQKDALAPVAREADAPAGPVAAAPAQPSAILQEKNEVRPEPPPATVPPRPAPKRQEEARPGADRADQDFAEAPAEAKKDVRLAPPAAPPPAPAPVDEAPAEAELARAKEEQGKLRDTVASTADRPALPPAANAQEAARAQKAVADDAEGRLAAGAAASAPAGGRSRETQLVQLRSEREEWRRRAAQEDGAAVRVVELGARIYALSGQESDRRQAVADAERYLADSARPGRERVRELRRSLER